jgi:hypothetical protein
MFNLFSRLRAGLPRLAAIALLACGVSAFAEDARFDPVGQKLTIPSVKVGGATYVDVTLNHLGNYVFQLAGATPGSAIGAVSGTYDLSNYRLALPIVRLGSQAYRVEMVNVGNFTFQLTAAAQVETYTYYSRTAPGLAQTATLINNTLTVDGIAITNFSFGETATDPSDTLQSWSAPFYVVPNQTTVKAMLFCASDGKLSYVVVKDAVQDPDRTNSTPSDLVDAIHAAPQRTGVTIYNNCSGQPQDKAWVNNLPNETYLLSPNLFTTYTRTQVLNQLARSVVFRQQGQTANQHNFLGLTWSGANAFEAWQ